LCYKFDENRVNTCVEDKTELKCAENHMHTHNTEQTRMWANAQRDGRPAEYGWRPLFNAAKFG